MEFLLNKASYLTELSLVGDVFEKRLGQYVGRIHRPSRHQYGER